MTKPVWTEYEGRMVFDSSKRLRPTMTVLDMSRGVIPSIVEVRPATDAEIADAQAAVAK